MKESVVGQRLRPSLLDRLTDLRPDSTVESSEATAVTERELRAQVERDLTWLFNTTHLASSVDLSAFAEVRRSVLNYGVVALTGRSLSSIDREGLESAMAEALCRFESRLLPDSVKVRALTGQTRVGRTALVLDIEAELLAEPLRLGLHLRTEVDLDTGRVFVAELADGQGR